MKNKSFKEYLETVTKEQVKEFSKILTDDLKETIITTTILNLIEQVEKIKEQIKDLKEQLKIKDYKN